MFTIGIDYGTNSVRAIVVRCSDGAELGSSVFNYPSGTQGVLLDPRNHNLARQHPGDYLLGLQKTVRSALAAAAAFSRSTGFDARKIIGIGVDATGSSPLPVDNKNVALGMYPKHRDNLAAQCWLWKDHTAHREAALITTTAAEHRPHYIAKCGNTYSSEWFWAKIWHCLNTAPKIFSAAHSWVELTDWIPSVLAGVRDPAAIKRGICCAGHKALYAVDWGGLPDKEFLRLLDPRLADLRDRLYTTAHGATTAAGALCPEWAKKLGLPAGIPIAIGEMDVHYGAIGSGIAEGALVKVIGTSTCDCAVISTTKKVADIPGICGIVNGAILPGYYGIEAGQSAVGDIFKWWVETVCQGDSKLHRALAAEVAAQGPGQSGLLALDWNNGNRTILVDQRLTGLLLGQTLHTTRAEIYRALIEATAFGARAIIERIREHGVPTTRCICAGGIAEKDPMLMQIYADVLGLPMHIAGSAQACALGGAVSAAVLAGAHKDFATAQRKMTRLKKTVYRPRATTRHTYDKLYSLYRKLHDAFGGLNKSADLSTIMKDLLAIKEWRGRPARSERYSLPATSLP
ncbi:ribulokinase [Opitutaceae bacterium TAV4]|uniref:ribulokinase n=1 Tax=Geminisphaera colitermitum TaxID=1148786 RepID=UPI000158C8A8|nr:ribulokinase [Geminisphaera colitermitum]RRJ94439.1 ribulokinase [Opitutaceae bacterium TAV4]RRJ98526.1 ribulokinase [Opitutaceae bacterium TAV3]